MIKEALEYFAGLARDSVAPIIIERGGRDYSDKEILPLKGPLPTPLMIGTLQGMLDLIEADFESCRGHSADVLLHVASPVQVELQKKFGNIWEQRAYFVTAAWNDPVKFPFNKWLSPDAFVIAVQCGFVETNDSQRLLAICSNLTSSTVTTSEDDGISQKFILQKSAAFKEERVILPRVRLSPYRIFREADQPVNDFIFRLKNGDDAEEPPQVALFEADGGDWRIQAVQNIKKFLETGLETLEIEIPVIA